MAVRKHGVFVASTKKSETLGAAVTEGNVPDVVEIEVVSVVGTAPIYFTAAADGGNPTDPTIRGDDTYVVQSGGSCRVAVRGALPVIVEMICAATDTYAVEVFTA